MNYGQLFGLMRTLGTIALTYLVSSGTLTHEQASDLGAAASQAAPILGILVLAGYGWYKKRDAGKILEAGKVQGAVVIVDPVKAAPAVVTAAVAAPDSQVRVGKL